MVTTATTNVNELTTRINALNNNIMNITIARTQVLDNIKVLHQQTS